MDIRDNVILLLVCIFIQIWLTFYHSHDILNTHIKFDNNRSSSLGDNLLNKNSKMRQADRQTETEDQFFLTLGS